MQQPILCGENERKAELFETNYQLLLRAVSELEIELIKLLVYPRKLHKGNPNPEFKIRLTTLHQKFESFIAEVLKGVKAYDDLATNFSQEVIDTQQVKILKAYSLYLFANRVFCFLDKNIAMTGHWVSLYEAINKLYTPQRQRVHNDGGSVECYLGSTFVTRLQTIVNEKAYLKGAEESAQLFLAIINLDAFCKMATNAVVKAQCYMMLHTIYSNDEVKPYLCQALSDANKSSYFYQKINPLVEANLTIYENKLLHFFAEGTVHLYNMSSIDTKKITKNQKTKQKFKSPNMILTPLRKFLPEALLAAKKLIAELKDHAAPRLHQPVIFNTIFQRNELIKENLFLHKSCLFRAMNILNDILSIPELKINNWANYCEVLQQQRDCLNLIIQCDRKLQDIEEGLPSDALQSQKLLKNSIADIAEYEQEVKRRDQNAQRFLQKMQPPAHRTAYAAKKLAKAQRTRDQFTAFRAQTARAETKTTPIVSSRYERLKVDAWKNFQRGAFFEALQGYKQLHDTTEDIYEKVSSATCIGDIYKKLLMLYKNKDSNIDFKAEAIKYYRLAESMALTYRLQRENGDDSTLETWEEIAKSLGDQLDPPKQKSKTLPIATTPEPVNKPTVLPDSKEAPPEYQTLKIILPVPDFLTTLRDLVTAQGYHLFIVGGYIKDQLLGETPNNIDLVVFDPTFKIDNFTLLNNLQRVLQTQFFCEIRSKKHPIIFLQHGNNITVAIAPLKIKSTFDLSKLVYTDALKVQLLASDATTRDTTDNALFYDFKQIHDFFNGIQDIKQNRIRCIKNPEISFKEDPIRIFRIIRAIVRRTISTPNVDYSNNILVALRQYAPAILLLNKDRCFSEIRKMLFRHNALATWQFLTKYDLLCYFFPCPEDKEKMFFHHLMVARLLSGLDRRVGNETQYDEILVYAVLWWGKFSECLEKVKSKLIALDGTIVRQTAYDLLTTSKSCFTIPAHCIHPVIMVWQNYLQMNHQMIIDKVHYISFTDFSIANVLSRLITKTLQIIPMEKVKFANYRHGFFMAQTIQMNLKAIMREHGIVCQKFPQGFYLAIPPNSHLTTKDKHSLLKNIKQHMSVMLGSLDIEYNLEENALTVKSQISDKHRSFSWFLQLIFDNEILQEEVTATLS